LRVTSGETAIKITGMIFTHILFLTVKVKEILENKSLTKTQYVGPSNKPGG
jgi:hypothetical protein